MTGNIVARRYARAIFAVGEKAGELDAYGKELGELAEALHEAPQALTFFKSPAFSPAEKKAVLGKLLEQTTIGQTVKNFCFLLADKGRLGFLPEIASDFQAMLDGKQGVMRGQLVTAVPLDDTKEADFVKQLESQTGKKLVLSFAEDKDILGGVVLKIGDKVLDASLRAQLELLRDNIKRGE
ncbi:MAG: ATP synthase F1 subunit delta [Desulfovibrionaceae bacterium]